MRYRALLSTVLLLGCGNGSIDGDADAEPDATEDPAPEVEIDPACEYPAGPYGTDVGDIMDNLTWDVVVGGGTVSLRQFHCDESTTLLWLYGTAGWCPNCPIESAALPGMYSDYHSEGLEIVACVFEDTSGNPADLEFAEDYVGIYEFPFAAVADSDILIGDYRDPSSAPINVFVDLETMEILFADDGFDEGEYTTMIESWLGL